jgi:hypothetical protein
MNETNNVSILVEIRQDISEKFLLEASAEVMK